MCCFYDAARKPFRAYQTKFLGTVGLTAGVMVGVLRSTQRLMGVMENNEEIMAYGIMESEALKEARRRQNYANIDLIEAKK